METTPPEPVTETTQETPEPLVPELYSLRIDGATLKLQQQVLQEIVSADCPHRAALFGVKALLEELAKQAYDKYHIDAINASPTEVLSGYMDRQQITAGEKQLLLVQLIAGGFNTTELFQMLDGKLPAQVLRQAFEKIVARRNNPSPIDVPKETP